MSVSIFISVVSDDFRDRRGQLRKDLTRHNVEVKVQENFEDPVGDTLDKYVPHCDLPDTLPSLSPRSRP